MASASFAANNWPRAKITLMKTIRRYRVAWLFPFLIPSLLAAAQEPSFHITPLRPVDELRQEALAAQPPHEQGSFHAPELVELVKLDPTIKLDIRYATANNFLSTP